LRILTLLDIHLTHFSNASTISRNQGLTVNWCPLETGTIKLNYDEATKGNPGIVGFGESSGSLGGGSLGSMRETLAPLPTMFLNFMLWNTGSTLLNSTI